jgi:hypothetical protein
MEERRPFVGLLRSAFARGTPAAALGRERWGRLARRLGLAASARASELDVWQWVRVFELLSARPSLRRS